jgi:type II secretory pathway component PulF
MLNKMFEPRIGLKPLVDLCRRLSTSLGAGVDIRSILAREAEHTRGHLRRVMIEVNQAIQRGETFSDALAPTGNYLPPIFRELCAVGEQSGQLDVVLHQLTDHYENQLTMRRNFLGSIAGPVIQLVLSLAVVGMAIWIAGIFRKDIDVYGLGLVGDRGLRIYVNILAVIAVAGWLVIRAIRRGVVWVRPVQHLVLMLPGIGKPLQTMALERLAWSMHLTMNTGMDVRRALKLSLRSTQNARYIDKIPEIDAQIDAGNSIHDTFRHAGCFPEDFLDILAVGEESGQVVESMGRLARLYQEQARLAVKALTIIAGWVIWMGIATFIIIMIFRVFSNYLHAIGG